MSLRRTAVTNMLWSMSLFWSRFVINAGTFIVLSRWLSIEEIGAYGSASALVQVAGTIISAGLPEVLIRRQQKADGLLDTAFWVSLGVGFLLSLLLAALSFGLLAVPITKQVGHYLLLLSIIPAVAGLGAISESAIRASMDMRRLALRTTVALSLAGAAAIGLAAAGYGGWALVWLTLLNAVLTTGINLFASPWRPGLRFDRQHVRPLVSEGLAIASRNVLKSSLNPTTQWIVAIFLGPAAAGAYYIAVRLVTIISSLTNLPAQFAALPIFSKVAHDPNLRRSAFVEASGIMSFITAPIYLGCFALASALLPLLFATNGTAPVPVLQGITIQSAVLVLVSLGTQAMTSVGAASLAFRFVAVQVLGNAILSLAAAQVSVAAVAWSYGLLYFLIAPYLVHLLSRALTIPRGEMLAAVFRPWISAVLMAAALMSCDHFLLQARSPLQRILLLVPLGAVLYPLLATLIARPQAVGFVKAIKSLAQSRNKQRSEGSS
jgi:O-antigen/teichoic acid export membrane protein